MNSPAAGATFAQYLRLRSRRQIALAGLALGLLVSLWCDLLAGPAGLDAATVVRGLVDPDSLPLRHRIILWEVRLPDALIAVAVGAALGLAGVETQTILDNPLASPFTLGMSSAAVFGASIAIVLAPSLPLVPQSATLPALALVTAGGAGCLVLLVSQLAGGAKDAVILFGIALVFMCNALTGALHYIADVGEIQQIAFWAIGNLTKAGWLEVAIVFAVFVLIFPISMRHVWLMTLLRGGEAQATSLGIDVQRLRTQVILRCSVLAAFAVCFVGTIGFVGLVGPHIARLLLGEDHRLLVPGAALSGALIMSVASALSKSMIPGVIVPVGILTAVVGVPVFLGLLARHWRRA